MIELRASGLDTCATGRHQQLQQTFEQQTSLDIFLHACRSLVILSMLYSSKGIMSYIVCACNACVCVSVNDVTVISVISLWYALIDFDRSFVSRTSWDEIN